MEKEFAWPLPGNKKIKEFLQKNLLSEKLAQSYVFFGPRDTGKKSLAQKFAQSVICENQSRVFSSAEEKILLPCGKCQNCLDFERGKFSDYYFLRREINPKTGQKRTQVSIDQIRNLIERLNKSSFVKTQTAKVAVIEDAEFLSLEAANALLKTLEEPTGKTVMILLTENLDAILPTILSRSQILRFGAVDFAEIYDELKNFDYNRDDLKEAVGLAGGRIVLAMKYLSDKQILADKKQLAQKAWALLIDNDFGKFKKIESLFSEDKKNEFLAEWLKEFSLIGRDLLMMKHSLPKSLSNFFLREEYEKFQSTLNAADLSDFLVKIESTKKMIWQNVSPRLAFENLLLNFSIKNKNTL